MKAIIKKIKVPVFEHSIMHGSTVTGTAEFKGDKYTELKILCCPVCDSKLSISMNDINQLSCWKCKVDDIERPD